MNKDMRLTDSAGMEKLLRYMYKKGASDMVLTAGISPQLRIRGELQDTDLEALKQYRERFASTPETEWLMSAVAGLAKDSEVRLVTIDPNTTPQEEPTFTKLAVTVKLEEDYHALGQFLSRLETFERLLRVEELTMSGQRAVKIFDLVEKVYEQYNRRVNTGELNRIVSEIVARNPPARYQGKEQKISYVTQVSTRPPTFIFLLKRCSKSILAEKKSQSV